MSDTCRYLMRVLINPRVKGELMHVLINPRVRGYLMQILINPRVRGKDGRHLRVSHAGID